MKEIYKNYYVTPTGDIYSAKSGKTIRQRTNRQGYLLANLSINGKCKTFSVHRLVAMAYLSNPCNYPEINHKNGVKTDNRVENLEWISHRNNVLHAIQTGLTKTAKGKSTLNGRFTEDEIRRIRLLKHQGFTIRSLARLFNVTHGAINQIVHYKIYAWVK